jgi:hypothetical protein
MINADVKLGVFGPQLGYPHSSAVRGVNDLRSCAPVVGAAPGGHCTGELGTYSSSVQCVPRPQVDPRRFRFGERARACPVGRGGGGMDHRLSQTALARQLGMHQTAIARLEAGDHEPFLATLARLARGIGTDFSIEITPHVFGFRDTA